MASWLATSSPGISSTRRNPTYCALHFVQRSDAAKRQRVLFGLGDQFVRGDHVGSQSLIHRIIDDAGPGVVAPAAAIASDIARQDGQHPSRVTGQSDQQSGLRQVEKAKERFLTQSSASSARTPSRRTTWQVAHDADAPEW